MPNPRPIRHSLTLAAALVLAACAACATGTAGTPAPAAAGAAADGDSALTGRYRGALMDVGNILPRTSAELVTVTLDRLTGAAELAELADIQTGARQEALRDALEGREVGRVQIGQGLSYPISAALAHDGEGEMRHLVLVIARPITLGEIWRSTRSLDYPFSVIELDLEPDGEGSGELNVAARVSFTADGAVQIEDLAVQPVRILGVDRVQG
jgi:hypothetical protein